MNTEGDPDGLDVAARRHRRARLARRLSTAGLPELQQIGWSMLDEAPAWIGLPDDELERRACRVGAVLCAAEIRLWIDGVRLGAAREALGADFLQALIGLPGSLLLPRGLMRQPPMDRAAQVAPALRDSGLTVLLASLPDGPLRRAASTALGLEPVAMVTALAQSLVGQVDALCARIEDTAGATT